MSLPIWERACQLCKIHDADWWITLDRATLPVCALCDDKVRMIWGPTLGPVTPADDEAWGQYTDDDHTLGGPRFGPDLPNLEIGHDPLAYAHL